MTRVSPLAELCACLHALDEPGHHPAAARWIARLHAETDSDLLARATAWAPLWGAFRARYLLPLSPSPGRSRSLADELAEIEALPIGEFTAMTLQALIGKNGAVLGPNVLQRLRLISSSRVELGARVYDDAHGFRRELLGFLTGFAAAAFDADWPGLRTALLAEAAVRERALSVRGAMTFADFPAATVSGDRIVLDKLYSSTEHITADRPCLLLPSLYGRPHFVVKHYPGYPIVIQYGVGSTAGPSLEVVRQRLAVLQHPTRLMLCRAILRNPVATAELATQLGMTAPQVSRHLRHLREAELVHVHRDGAAVYYQLDAEAVGRVGADLLTVLYR